MKKMVFFVFLNICYLISNAQNQFSFCITDSPTLKSISNLKNIKLKWFDSTQKKDTISELTKLPIGKSTFYFIKNTDTINSKKDTANIQVFAPPKIFIQPTLTNYNYIVNDTSIPLYIQTNSSLNKIRWYINNIASNVGGKFLTPIQKDTFFYPLTIADSFYYYINKYNYYYAVVYDSSGYCFTKSNVSGKILIDINPQISDGDTIKFNFNKLVNICQSNLKLKSDTIVFSLKATQKNAVGLLDSFKLFINNTSSYQNAALVGEGIIRPIFKDILRYKIPNNIAGSYYYFVIIKNKYGASITSNISGERIVHTNPTVKINTTTILPDKKIARILYGEKLPLVANVSGPTLEKDVNFIPTTKNYTWKIGDNTFTNYDSNLTISPTLDSTIVLLKGTNGYGCSNYDTLTVWVRDKNINQENILDISNMFTPNGDNINDYWLVKKLSPFKYTIIIYNTSTNQLIRCFSNQNGCLYDNKKDDPRSIYDLQKGWDGKDFAGNKITTGVYFYTVELSELNYYQKGFISVLSE